MIKDIPEIMLHEMSRLITTHTGLYFPEKKWKALNKGIQSAIKDLNIDLHDFYQTLKAAPSREMVDAITHRLTVGETYFLRDKNLFQILQDHILRGIIHHPKRKTQKIILWSAGCATGEEPYSIAILIDQMASLLKGWDITIIGSDINPKALENAKKGIYSNWSLRGTPEKIIKKYFTFTGGIHFEIAPHIRKMVQFSRLNLMDNNYSSILNIYDGMDIILCRNVLMYFNEPSRDFVLQKLSNQLIDNGWLITGPAESGFVSLPELTSVRFPNAMYHRKGPPRKDPERRAPFERIRQSPRTRPIVPAYSAKKPAERKYARRITDRRKSTSPEKPKYDMYQEAVNEYDQGHYARSVEILLSIISREQNCQSAFLMRTESMILLAKSYANIGELEQARVWCEKAIDTEKLNPEIYFLLSTICQSAGDIDESLKPLKQSIYLDPEFVMAHFTLGMMMLRKNLPTESKKSMKNALSLLGQKDADEILPNSEGMTAGRLLATIKAMKI